MNTELKNELVAEFKGQIISSVRHQFKRLHEIFGPTFRGVYNSKSYSLWTLTVRPCTKRLGNRMDDEIVLCEDNMAEYAQAQAELNPAVNLVSTPKAPEAVSSEKKIAEKEDEVIRVNLSRIDSLNNFVGEMIVQLSVLQQQAVQNAAAPLISSLRQMNKLSKEIQDLSMSLQLPARREFWKLQDGLELFLRAQFPLSLACSNQRALSQRVPFR